MPFKITSVMALATLVGAAAAASRPMTTNEDPAEARRLTDSFEAIGCYTDAASPRIMGNMLSLPDMTTELCADFCSEIPGSKFFGTQYGIECFCGDESTDFEYYGPSSTCTMACDGDFTEICGGFWAMSVYEYTETYN